MPPSGNITDDDSGDEDVTVNNLSSRQLTVEAIATKWVGGERVEMTATVDEFSDEGTTGNGKPDIVEMNAQRQATRARKKEQGPLEQIGKVKKLPKESLCQKKQGNQQNSACNEANGHNIQAPNIKKAKAVKKISPDTPLILLPSTSNTQAVDEALTEVVNSVEFNSKQREWVKKDIPRNESKFQWAGETPAFLATERSPLGLFELFFDENVLKLMCEHSVTYALQKGNHGFTIAPNEMKTFLGIILLSGYCVLPRRRMY